MNEHLEENKTYILDGKEIKPNLAKNDITEEMKARAYDLAFRSLEKYSVERDMADYVKSKFDEEFLPCWQCVVGKDYAVSLSHESENFLFFSIENTYFLIFKI
jgi:dynein light chain LC8-type